MHSNMLQYVSDHIHASSLSYARYSVETAASNTLLVQVTHADMINTCSIEKHIAITNLARHFCCFFLHTCSLKREIFCKYLLQKNERKRGKDTITILQPLCRVCFSIGVLRWATTISVSQQHLVIIHAVKKVYGSRYVLFWEQIYLQI